MIVEIIAVGTELLLGQIINTNAADIGTRLADDGFDVHFQTTVGDNLDRLADSIRTGIGRADAVVLTGGIGPTQDDMTRDAICAVLGTEVVRDEQHAAAIRERLETRGVVADSALRMADYPAGTEPLPNSKGVALGICAQIDEKLIFAVPGVPTEMRAMIDEQVRPRLREASGEPSVLINRVLHSWGLGESQISERLDDLYGTTNPSVAFLIKGPEVRIRITAKAATQTEAVRMTGGVEDQIRSRLGDAVFGVDAETVDDLLFAQLKTRRWTVSAVEGLSAGELSARLRSFEGFAGSVVVAHSAELPDSSTAEIEARAVELLEKKAPPADVTIAVSEAFGHATGESISARKVSIAVRTPAATMVRTLDVFGDDERARAFAVPGALHILRQAMSSDLRA